MKYNAYELAHATAVHLYYYWVSFCSWVSQVKSAQPSLPSLQVGGGGWWQNSQKDVVKQHFKFQDCRNYHTTATPGHGFNPVVQGHQRLTNVQMLCFFFFFNITMSGCASLSPIAIIRSSVFQSFQTQQIVLRKPSFKSYTPYCSKTNLQFDFFYLIMCTYWCFPSDIIWLHILSTNHTRNLLHIVPQLIKSLWDKITSVFNGI